MMCARLPDNVPDHKTAQCREVQLAAYAEALRPAVEDGSQLQPVAGKEMRPPSSECRLLRKINLH